MEDRIKWLDSIRGIACMIVLVTHIVSTDSKIGMYMSGCGKIGVWLFMILSGFFLMRPYTGGVNFTYRDIVPFWIQKILTIIPCFMIALLLARGGGIHK